MGFDKNIAHIVYASDDKFAEIMGVSIVSLLYNSKDMDEIVIYILDSGIREVNKEKIESIFRYYDRALPIWIPAKDISKELSMEVAADRGSLSQYARLFISSDLPENLSRVLYLDCDIVINQSIYELWNLDIHGKTIGALMDAFSKYYRDNINLRRNDIMFNSGVMLIDMKKWKAQKVEERLLKFIAEKHGKIQQGDQGALNYVLSSDTYCFEPKFNAVTIFYDFTYKEMLIYRKPPKYYSEVQVKESVESPVIIHYTTSFLSKRPWMVGCNHRYVGKWLQFKLMSPWKDTELWEDNSPKWKQKALKIYKKLPSGLAVRIAGLMQAYGRPLINKLKNN